MILYFSIMLFHVYVQNISFVVVLITSTIVKIMNLVKNTIVQLRNHPNFSISGFAILAVIFTRPKHALLFARNRCDFLSRNRNPLKLLSPGHSGVILVDFCFWKSPKYSLVLVLLAIPELNCILSSATCEIEWSKIKCKCEFEKHRWFGRFRNAFL